MNILKIILVVAGIILAGWLALSVIGIIYSALFYIFLLGIVAIAGAVGYKLIAKDHALELEEKSPVSKIELDNAKAVKNLEEYKRKHLE
jgi:amino acid permease